MKNIICYFNARAKNQNSYHCLKWVVVEARVRATPLVITFLTAYAVTKLVAEMPANLDFTTGWNLLPRH